MCVLNNTVIYLNNNIPTIEKFKCKRKKFNDNLSKKNIIGGIPNNRIIYNINNNIPNQFFISKIILHTSFNNYSKIIIKGKLLQNLVENINDLNISVVYPKTYLNCSLDVSSNYVQSNIYCYSSKIIDSEILIENQIIYNKYLTKCLLLINQITLYQNYEIVEKNDIVN